MTHDQTVGLLREFGFPIVVSLWFMLSVSKALVRVFALLSKLMEAVALLAQAVDFHINLAKKPPPPQDREPDQ